MQRNKLKFEYLISIIHASSYCFVQPCECLLFCLQRIPWAHRDGEYFCPILCCWRPIEAGTAPTVSRLNDPAAVVTAQRRRALLQPIIHQVFTSPVPMQRGQPAAQPVRINMGGTQYQVPPRPNMSCFMLPVYL